MWRKDGVQCNGEEGIAHLTINILKHLNCGHSLKPIHTCDAALGRNGLTLPLGITTLPRSLNLYKLWGNRTCSRLSPSYKPCTKGLFISCPRTSCHTGYAQKKGIDYEETFAPTSRMTTIRVVVAMVAHYGWFVHQLDIKTAFLNGDLEEQFPLLSKCARLQRLTAEALERNKGEVELHDFPGGVETFELCAKFCYGITITLNAYNVVAVRCAAEHLEMTEAADKGNLIFKEHPGLTKSERKKLCRLLDCKKFSMEACMHAAQNERLPLRVIVQVLFFEQVRASMTGGVLLNELPSGVRALMAAQEGEFREGSSLEDRWEMVEQNFKSIKGDLASMKLKISEVEREHSSVELEDAKSTSTTSKPKKFLCKLWPGKSCSDSSKNCCS